MTTPLPFPAGRQYLITSLPGSGWLSGLNLAALLGPLTAAQDALVRLDAAAAPEPVRQGLIARLPFREAAGWLATMGAWVHPRDLANHCRVLNGALWICRTGAPWRDLPEQFGNWNSVFRQYRSWCLSGVWDLILQALADSGGDLDMLQMIDSTIVRAHRCAAGEKGGFSARPSVARAAGSAPKSTFGATPAVCRSAWC